MDLISAAAEQNRDEALARAMHDTKSMQACRTKVNLPSASSDSSPRWGATSSTSTSTRCRQPAAKSPHESPPDSAGTQPGLEEFDSLLTLVSSRSLRGL